MKPHPTSSYRWLIVGMLQLVLAIWLLQLALPQAGNLRSHLFLAGCASAGLGAYSGMHGLKEKLRR